MKNRRAVADFCCGQSGLRDFDILIVDEAHNLAPSGTGNYALDSQRTRAWAARSAAPSRYSFLLWIGPIATAEEFYSPTLMKSTFTKLHSL